MKSRWWLALVVAAVLCGSGVASAQVWMSAYPYTSYYTPAPAYYGPSAYSTYYGYYGPGYTTYYPGTSWYSTYYSPYYAAPTYYYPGSAWWVARPRVYVPGQPVRNALRGWW